MEEKESIVAAVKKFLLPELDAIKNSYARVEIRLDAVEKRLSDINAHLIDQGRRIDETNNRINRVIDRIDETNSRIESVKDELTKRIDGVREELATKIEVVRDELTKRIDGTNARIDQLTFQVGKLGQEMEKIRMEQAITADMLSRLRKVEDKVANL